MMILEIDLLASLKTATYVVAAGIEALAGVLVVLTVLKATGQIVRLLLRRHPAASETAALPTSMVPRRENAEEMIRLQMGRGLVLALEFALAADILHTAVAPSWEDLGKLAAIITVRTVLNYFLQVDIDKVARGAAAA